MILGKLTRYLRTLESKLASLSQENTMQWILMKPVLFYHYKLLHLLIAIEQIHTISDLWTFISILSSIEKNQAIVPVIRLHVFRIDEFSFSTKFFKHCIIEFVFITQITRLDHYKFHIVDFHVI